MALFPEPTFISILSPIPYEWHVARLTTSTPDQLLPSLWEIEPERLEPAPSAD